MWVASWSGTINYLLNVCIVLTLTWAYTLHLRTNQEVCPVIKGVGFRCADSMPDGLADRLRTSHGVNFSLIRHNSALSNIDFCT